MEESKTSFGGFLDGFEKHKTDEVINILRVLINHLVFMDESTQRRAVGKANEMLDSYFAHGGKFISCNLSEWLGK